MLITRASQCTCINITNFYCTFHNWIERVIKLFHKYTKTNLFNSWYWFIIIEYFTRSKIIANKTSDASIRRHFETQSTVDSENLHIIDAFVY